LFADAVAQLGKYAILYSGAIEALKNAIAGASGVTGIAVGIGLIALSALIKAAIGGIGKTGGFAVGTRYAPGGMSLVGERGPELVNLPRGSQVVPAAQTSAMLGGRQQVEVVGVLRGQDIYFSNKKYSQTYNRQT
jgi:phage-related tail protein